MEPPKNGDMTDQDLDRIVKEESSLIKPYVNAELASKSGNGQAPPTLEQELAATGLLRGVDYQIDKDVQEVKKFFEDGMKGIKPLPKICLKDCYGFVDATLLKLATCLSNGHYEQVYKWVEKRAEKNLSKIFRRELEEAEKTLSSDINMYEKLEKEALKKKEEYTKFGILGEHLENKLYAEREALISEIELLQADYQQALESSRTDFASAIHLMIAEKEREKERVDSSSETLRRRVTNYHRACSALDEIKTIITHHRAFCQEYLEGVRDAKDKFALTQDLKGLWHLPEGTDFEGINSIIRYSLEITQQIEKAISVPSTTTQV